MSQKSDRQAAAAEILLSAIWIAVGSVKIIFPSDGELVGLSLSYHLLDTIGVLQLTLGVALLVRRTKLRAALASLAISPMLMLSSFLGQGDCACLGSSTSSAHVPRIVAGCIAFLAGASIFLRGRKR